MLKHRGKGKNMIELIDTCWDVNGVNDVIDSETGCELIDTCWDVNYCESDELIIAAM